MRTFPAGWSDPLELVQTPPTIYLHVLDSSWPPASSDGEYPLDAGWVEVGSWTTNSDLVAPLLPGQIKGQSGFASSDGQVSFKHALSLTPWATGDERVVTSKTVEIVASHDGPSGTSAVSLGRFLLDPVSGKASDSVLSVDLVDTWSQLDRPHRLGQFGVSDDDPSDYPFDPSRLIRRIAKVMGWGGTVPDLGTSLTSNYFPGTATWKDCLTAILAANLAAATVTADDDIRVLTYEDLSGVGAPVDTLIVLDEFEDLVWVVDPAEKVDRVTVTYSIPEYVLTDDNSDVEDRRDIAPWVSPTKYRMLPGASASYEFDAGAAVGGFLQVDGNSAKNGSGSVRGLLQSFINVSVGLTRIRIRNQAGSTSYRVDTDGEPSFLSVAWKNVAETDGATTISWGETEANALNPIDFDFGSLIQNDTDAERVLARIVARVRAQGTRIQEVNVVPDLRRELGDLVWLDYAEDGLSTKAIITSIKNGGVPGQLTQTLGLALLAPLIADFNAAWDAAMPGATIADFNAFWAGKTVADFNENPLAT